MSNFAKRHSHKSSRGGRFSKKSEPEFYHASKNKNLDNVKLLISHLKVKEIVTETRKYVGIPEGGLKNDQIEQWHKRDDLRSDEIMNSPEFIRQELGIRKKFQEKKLTRSKTQELMKELYNQIPINFLNDQIWRIIRQFNVPDNYERHIYDYILYGTVSAPTANYSIGPFKPWEKLRDVRRVPITVYAKLTDNDLRDLKLQVNKYFGGKRLTFIQDTKDIDRDLDIEKSLDEKEYDYATGKEYKLSSGDVAERFFKSRKRKGDVLKVKERLRKLRKTRFGKL